MNYLVGENNTGKTTIFQAIEFLIKKVSREAYIYNEFIDDTTKDVSVTLELADCIPLSETVKKYQDNVFGEDNCLKVRKTSATTITKGKSYDIKNVLIYNEKEHSYENISGVATTISALLNCQFIYANQHNEEAQDFSSNKILGKLISQVTSDFKNTDIFNKYKSIHESVFGEDGIKKYLCNVEKDLSNIVASQFGESVVNFEFEFPKMNDLLKKGTIAIEENGLITDINEKGNGLQRALLLALIQVSSKYTSKNNDNMFYFIDGPELYLHPRAQNKLFESLNQLATENNQIFITTHSPYSFINYDSNSKVYILDRVNNEIQYDSMEDLILSEVTIGEISYRAFKIPNVDFHHRLFSDVYEMWLEKCQPEHTGLNSFDKSFLSEKYHIPTKKYVPKKEDAGERKRYDHFHILFEIARIIQK